MRGTFKSENGSVVVEFAFYLFIFMLMCGILMDMTFSLIKKSEIERVNNSLMSVIRERNAFYEGKPYPSQQEFDQLKSIADNLLRKSDGTIEPYQLELMVAIPFSSIVDVDGQKKPDSSHRPSFGEDDFITKDIEGCNISKHRTVPATEELGELSVFGQPPGSADPNGIWYPVYELTICVPGAVSHFNQMLGLINKKMGSLYIRNVSLPRI